MRLLFFSLLTLLTGLFFVAPLSAQYITTIAGNGVSACNLNGQPALCTPFSYPQSVCGAANGDLYITCGNSIKMLSAATGIVTAVAGSDTYGSTGDGGSATNATFMNATSVRLDNSGNIYIAEYSGQRIRKIDVSTGIISTIAGNGVAGYSGDGGPATSANINQPQDLAIDVNGNIYIADFTNCRIRKIDAITGNISTIAGTGATSYSGDGGAATSAGLVYPNSICLDSKGNLYISESSSGTSCRIRKVDAITGIISTIAGNNAYAYSGDGGLAVNASLFDPSGVFADASGNIYVSEYDDSRIRKIDAFTGIISTIAGTGTNSFTGDNGLAKNATLNNPVGLFADNTGNLFVCDNQNLRVRKIFVNATTPPSSTPQISISSSTTSVCNTNTIVFTATATNAPSDALYQWEINGAATGTNAATFTGTDMQSGDVVTCTLYYSVCSMANNVVSNGITLTGGSSGAISLSIVASDTTICQKQNVTFTASAVNAGSSTLYQWKLNGNNVGSNDSMYSNNNLADGDMISCELTADAEPPCNPGGTATSGSIVMKVGASSPIINISASDNDVCPGTKVTFTATVQNASSSSTYQWKLNNADVGTNSPTFIDIDPANNDSIFCVITSNGNCSVPVSSNIIALTVKSLPAITVYPLDTTVKKGSQVQLQASIDNNVSSYAWSPANELNGASSLTPITIALLDNTIFIFKIITNDGCADSATATIKVTQQLYMPSAFSPNGDGKNDIFRIPPSTALNLKDFTIYNRWGQVVFATSNISIGWDGTYKGMKQDAGTYTYLIRGTDDKGQVIATGTVVLAR